MIWSNIQSFLLLSVFNIHKINHFRTGCNYITEHEYLSIDCENYD